MVCVLSVFNGFSTLIEEKLSSIDPDLKIYPSLGKEIANADSVASELQQRFDAIRYALPVIEDNALAVYGEKQMPVSIKAVTQEHEQTCGIAEAVKPDGRYLLTDSFGDYAVISVGAAMSLSAHPGYTRYLRLYTPKRIGKVNPTNYAGAFRSDTVFITGVFQIDEMNYDASTMIVPISVGRHLFDYPTQSTAIEITTNKSVAESELMSKIKSYLGPDYVVKNRLMQQETSFRMINIEKWISFLLLAFILLIAMFNVVSALSVLIVEKKSAIKSLSNLGATRGFIVGVFAWQTVIIGVLGTFIGVVLGIAMSLLQEHYGLLKLSGDTNAMIVDAYPVMVQWMDVVAVGCMSIAVSALSAVCVALIAASRVKDSH